MNKSNRLAKEPSPYLIQHADNPVDWYPWGKEAFDDAARYDKPIFLSVGYSTCHWCHVMAHESFEDTGIADLLNNAFVCIKVDREERPDVDRTYMTVCQMLTGSGGWPLTAVMTPKGEPFFAATYIPRESQFARVGLRDLIPEISKAWKTRREEILRAAAEILTALQGTQKRFESMEPSSKMLEDGYSELAGNFDSTYGGFGTAPKFPMPHQLLFLLRYGRSRKLSEAGFMVEKTLQNLRQGGIYDQVGFGFHRYSTDERWLVPHFEKMLYDQALLAMVYLEAFVDTGKNIYADTAREIFTYIVRDMTDGDGGFYTAEDADSEGGEGAFYVWRDSEMAEILGEEDADLARQIFSVEASGNFISETSRRLTGLNILHLAHPVSETASKPGMEEGDLKRRCDIIRAKLLASRQMRPHPLLDDKILTDWNGLMIAALAMGARVLGEQWLAAAALNGLDFILARLQDAGGRLFHRYRKGSAAIPAFLDDYAFFIWGLIECHLAGIGKDPLRLAGEMQARQDDYFRDDPSGCYYLTAGDAETVLVRQVEFHDGAIPSGNAVSFFNLVRLSRLGGDASLENRAAHLARALSGTGYKNPSAHSMFLVGLNEWLYP